MCLFPPSWLSSLSHTFLVLGAQVVNLHTTHSRAVQPASRRACRVLDLPEFYATVNLLISLFFFFVENRPTSHAEGPSDFAWHSMLF